ncbi:DUF6318 family protein [Arthrobacter sp. MYb224]|uniref:DUF6318 family protein n=1 Tax=Arthrobacter sp. MYb224 TaxID=1848600 RepID=UPI0011B07487|nr:DUF6318 family protein [Arthrobacter sp. MYb224]
MNTRKIAVAQSVVLACALTVTACAGGASPPDPTESSSPVVQESKTTMPSPSPAKPKYEPATAKGPAKNVPKPQMPELAKKQNEEGAIAFVKYYFEVMNYSLETYTVDELIEITMRSCQLCGDNFIDPVRSHAKKKYWQVSGDYETNVYGVKLTVTDEALVEFGAKTNRVKVYSSTNNIIAESPAMEDESLGIATLHWKDRWMMNDVTFSE